MGNENGTSGRENRGRGPRGGDKGRGPERGKRPGRGDRGDRGRPGGRESSPATAGYRVVAELSVLEKALSLKDFAKQKAPLEEILKALKPLRLRSLDDLDMNTRGRLLTTLLRVGRQTKPPAPAVADSLSTAGEVEQPDAAAANAAPALSTAGEAEQPDAAAANAAPALATAGEAEQSDAAAANAAPASAELPPPAAEAPSTNSATEQIAGGDTPGKEGEAGESDASAANASSAPAELPPAGAEPTASQSKPPKDEKTDAYSDVMFLLGCVWKAAGDERRAATYFSASGRKADQTEAIRTIAKTGDWKEQAKLLESQGKIRDAARLHERHKSIKEATRLYEASGDVRSALRSALSEKNADDARRLLGLIKPDQSRPILEKAGNYELLMEQYVQARDFDSVARLYERARQFDQAALAWERAGKLANARKAFERARDPIGAERVRALEVTQLIKRGDRLGAASLLISSDKKDEAVKILTGLPGPKAFQFMQKLKLDAEAITFARSEISKADQENRPAAKARWLEQVGEPLAAAEAWEVANRRDKALGLYEQAGNWEKAARLAEQMAQLDKAAELYHRAGDKASAERVAALPRPPAAPAVPPPSDDDQLVAETTSGS